MRLIWIFFVGAVLFLTSCKSITRFPVCLSSTVYRFPDNIQNELENIIKLKKSKHPDWNLYCRIDAYGDTTELAIIGYTNKLNSRIRKQIKQSNRFVSIYSKRYPVIFGFDIDYSGTLNKVVYIQGTDIPTIWKLTVTKTGHTIKFISSDSGMKARIIEKNY